MKPYLATYRCYIGHAMIDVVVENAASVKQLGLKLKMLTCDCGGKCSSLNSCRAGRLFDRGKIRKIS
jgi:hypothetical protein